MSITPAPTPPSGAAAAPPAPPPPADEEVWEDNHPATTGRFLLLNATPSWAVSAVVHFVLFIILALLQVPEREKSDVTTISSTRPEVMEEIEEFKTDKIELKLDDSAVVTNTSSEVIQTLTSDIVQ